MALVCSNCGMDNADAAVACRRCRVPFDLETLAHDEPAQADAGHGPHAPGSLGEVCQRCETYNEPGTRRCTTCGLALAAVEADESSLSDELAGLAISDEDARDALGPRSAPPDATPREGAAPVSLDDAFLPGAPATAHRELPARARLPGPGHASTPAAARPVVAPPDGPPPGWGGRPELPEKRQPPVAPGASAQEKACTTCGIGNPPAAKFCSDCGTPFAKAKAAAAAAPASAAELEDGMATAEQAPLPIAHGEVLHGGEPSVVAEVDDAPVALEPDDAPVALEPDDAPVALEPDDAPAPLEASQEGTAPVASTRYVDETPSIEVDGGVLAEAAPEEAPLEAESVAEAVEELPPFHAALIVERGSDEGTAFALGRMENPLGGPGAAIELHDDPYLAAHQATLVFEEQRLLLRDEGAANGVYLRVREWTPLEPGDHFIAGERLLRFDGQAELSAAREGDTPFLGAPRPKGAVLRVTEVLQGGKPGRVCLRTGPVISVGKAGCDLNFPADEHLGPRHAELRVGEGGAVTLHDLGAAPAGVFVRLRERAAQELQAGDVLLVGAQQLRLELA